MASRILSRVPPPLSNGHDAYARRSNVPGERRERIRSGAHCADRATASPAWSPVMSSATSGTSRLDEGNTGVQKPLHGMIVRIVAKGAGEDRAASASVSSRDVSIVGQAECSWGRPRAIVVRHSPRSSRRSVSETTVQCAKVRKQAGQIAAMLPPGQCRGAYGASSAAAWVTLPYRAPSSDLLPNAGNSTESSGVAGHIPLGGNDQVVPAGSHVPANGCLHLGE